MARKKTLLASKTSAIQTLCITHSITTKLPDLNLQQKKTDKAFLTMEVF